MKVTVKKALSTSLINLISTLRVLMRSMRVVMRGLFDSMMEQYGCDNKREEAEGYDEGVENAHGAHKCLASGDREVEEGNDDILRALVVDKW